MENTEISKVEKYFLSQESSGKNDASYRKIPTIIVDNYVILGQLTALRFLEWVFSFPNLILI